VSFSSETDQIARAAAGDRAAAGSLVARHSPAIFSLAARLLRDRTEAEDVTQEVFLRAWRILPTWQAEAKLSTWLHRVALNLCYDKLRKRRESYPGDVPEQIDRALAPHDALDQSQRVGVIEGAIAALPERQASALLLCAVHGHSQMEAASILGISEAALESLLARARRTLRARLFGPGQTMTDGDT
jgi:RNA polymerase sigma-70 factor, ECF subfamily